MKKKNLFLIIILILFLFQGCGYEPVYSSKNFVFKVGKIDYENNRINNQIAQSLKSLSNKNAQNIIDLELNSKKEKDVISKDKSGDPQIFNLRIIINIKIKDDEKIFISEQTYNNNENKFELNQFESEIEKQLISEIIDDILIHLAQF